MIEWLLLGELTRAWHVKIGPFVFRAQDWAEDPTQPTLAQAKTYIGAHESDETLTQVIVWAEGQRDRMASAATAAGRDPSTITRITKYDTLIAHLGDMI